MASVSAAWPVHAILARRIYSICCDQRLRRQYCLARRMVRRITIRPCVFFLIRRRFETGLEVNGTFRRVVVHQIAKHDQPPSLAEHGSLHAALATRRLVNALGHFLPITTRYLRCGVTSSMMPTFSSTAWLRDCCYWSQRCIGQWNVHHEEGSWLSSVVMSAA